jgi:hypothetical protein
MEQSGFRPEDEVSDHGWQRYLAGLEQVAAGLD